MLFYIILGMFLFINTRYCDSDYTKHNLKPVEVTFTSFCITSYATCCNLNLVCVYRQNDEKKNEHLFASKCYEFTSLLFQNLNDEGRCTFNIKLYGLWRRYKNRTCEAGVSGAEKCARAVDTAPAHRGSMTEFSRGFDSPLLYHRSL